MDYICFYAIKRPPGREKEGGHFSRRNEVGEVSGT